MLQIFQGDFLVLSSLVISIPVSAQITPDGTIPTVVNQSGNVSEITGGEQAGGNLFHSFNELSVPTGSEAFFNNALDIDNIISRVTGGSISNIDGLIRANGSANFFLINPAGIIFGNNARLDLGGSFLGSTADSLLFPEGEFRATDTQTKPLLTINAPIGLNFRDNPGTIVNQSVANNAGLQVALGKNITLVGGDINLDGGKITAPGGRVELGGLSAAGEVEINTDGSLNFPDEIEKADVSLTNQALVDVSSGEGGLITLNAENFSLSEQSNLIGGIGTGDIVINTTSTVLQNDSEIISNGGDIKITTDNLQLIESSSLGISITGEESNIENIVIDEKSLILIDESVREPTVIDTNLVSNIAADFTSRAITDSIEGETQNFSSIVAFDLIGSSEWLLDITRLERKDMKACRAKGRKRASRLTIKGKGGIPPELTAPLVSDTIQIEGEETARQASEKKESEIDTLVESQEPLSPDDIIPARGAIVLENGDVILTAYPTPNDSSRTPNSVNCS